MSKGENSTFLRKNCVISADIPVIRQVRRNACAGDRIRFLHNPIGDFSRFLFLRRVYAGLYICGFAACFFECGGGFRFFGAATGIDGHTGGALTKNTPRINGSFRKYK